jgi:hypothetical protein
MRVAPDAVNSFEGPERAAPSDLACPLRGDAVQVTVPRHAVAALELEVA